MGLENYDVWADLDGSGSLTTRYLRGDAIDQVFARVDGSDPYWYLTDHLGSIRDITDDTGAVVKSVSYDAFGNILSQSGTGDLGRYAWTGREVDVETGLQYNRARYYDPTIGRWISRDPMGFDAGDGNLYRYVGNSVTSNTDPSGKIAPLVVVLALVVLIDTADELETARPQNNVMLSAVRASTAAKVFSSPHVAQGVGVAGSIDYLDQKAGQVDDIINGKPVRRYDPGQTLNNGLAFGQLPGIVHQNHRLIYPLTAMGGVAGYKHWKNGENVRSSLAVFLTGFGLAQSRQQFEMDMPRFSGRMNELGFNFVFPQQSVVPSAATSSAAVSPPRFVLRNLPESFSRSTMMGPPSPGGMSHTGGRTPIEWPPGNDTVLPPRPQTRSFEWPIGTGNQVELPAPGSQSGGGTLGSWMSGMRPGEFPVAPQGVRGSVEVIDQAAAGRLRPANPQGGVITLYHGNEAGSVTNTRTNGLNPALGTEPAIQGGGNYFNVTIDPAVAVRYAQRYGGNSGTVGVIRIPEATWNDLVQRGLITVHPTVNPIGASFQIAPEAQQVINGLLGH